MEHLVYRTPFDGHVVFPALGAAAAEAVATSTRRAVPVVEEVP